MQAGWDDLRLPVGGDRPGQLLRAEVRGHFDREQSPLPSGQKMCRLALVRTSGLDSIVRTDAEIDFLLRVAVEIPKKQAEASVSVLEPSFKRAGDAGTGLVDGFEREVLPNKSGDGTQEAQEAQKKRHETCFEAPVSLLC